MGFLLASPDSILLLLLEVPLVIDSEPKSIVVDVGEFALFMAPSAGMEKIQKRKKKLI